jgi:hypothetical protein
MNKVYGFEGEAKDKYGDMTYKLFADVFTASKYHLTSSSLTSPPPSSRFQFPPPLSSSTLLQSIRQLVPSELDEANTQSH